MTEASRPESAPAEAELRFADGTASEFAFDYRVEGEEAHTVFIHPLDLIRGHAE